MRVFVFLLSASLCLQSCGDRFNILDSSFGNSYQKQDTARRAEVLFLGHDSQHHNSAKYAPWLAISLFKEGINLSYTEQLEDINTENLSKYDGLIIYANHDSLPPAQELALKNFLENGKGLIPIHSASGCFRNSDWYINTIGGQFHSHSEGVFAADIHHDKHALAQKFQAFETWDETYVHQRLASDNIVLSSRNTENGTEPYTWIRELGKGRVFYTAYGHNDSTWINAGFLQLVNQGVLWALGEEVNQKIARLDIPDVSIYDSITISDFTKRYFVPKMQEALSPEESMKLIQVPVDFEVQLFASEPDITNPIAMSWDEKGRLWVVESVDYPNTFLETDGAANDRIKICEDTDGDGKADKFTVFADSLNIPTSMAFAKGGVIVSMAPDFVFLKDTDGDDKADIRKKIISGWGKNDTHAGPSNLQYGFDNKIWGVLGYSGFEGKVNGISTAFRQGVYRFNADGSDFEYLANTSNNTWGLGFSEENDVFISTANNTHSAYYAMPAKYMQRKLPVLTASNSSNPKEEIRDINAIQKIDGHYDAHAMTPNLRQVDVVGGFTSAAGHHLYTARSFPKPYWNRIAFVNEPTIRLVHNAVIEKEGAGFTEADGWNLMASSDEWFGPVQSQVGPDGAVWVADWYNFIIQHNVFVERQAPSRMVLPFTDQPHGQGNAFISPLRDINYGRIYRIVYKDAPEYEPIALSKEDEEGLLQALKNDNMFWRMTAQRLIVESGKSSMLSGLVEIIENQEVDEIGLNSPAVHSLWTLHGLGLLEGHHPEALQAAKHALQHPAAGVRKAAVQVLPKNISTFEAIRSADLLNDPSLHVRMATALTLAEIPAETSIGNYIFEASAQMENAKDPWLRKALFAAAISHEKGFLEAGSNLQKTESVSIRASILAALQKEVYDLPRRGTIPYPVEVAGKEISITASVKRRDEPLRGVIMAHADQQEGYGLYLENQQLVMEVKHQGKSYQARSKSKVPAQSELRAELKKDGKMLLYADNKLIGEGKAPALVRASINSVIRTSYDFEDDSKLGSYEGDNRLNGELNSISLELKSTDSDTSSPALASTNAEKESSDGQESNTIYLKVVPDMMKYDKAVFSVKAGEKVTIALENLDGMQHNLLILKPGSLQKVGKAADALARDPDGAQKDYVPDMPEVLFATKMLNPEEVVNLTFTVPDEAGEYPFVCTFPGHWRMMNGIMKVEKASDFSR
ncbi:ThuA domain-containing protein [Porifericola rhodea]|uniref:PVC-type heme-binding CxxCH protein n=1 Tax=Porifericola rhodea TaxID=930972 RepID=UPI00266713FB|nr:PVC-type heme-binding CxxCH protein [Porifericola rhodea]WKN30933.1 ThuA domain-containing protein [Porifericola rhodea]